MKSKGYHVRTYKWDGMWGKLTAAEVTYNGERIHDTGPGFGRARARVYVARQVMRKPLTVVGIGRPESRGRGLN